MSYNILVVDDDREIAQLINIYLKNEGYMTKLAANGREALELFQAEPFHLVVLDLMMPEIDGLEVCRSIRKHQNVPILIVSAKAEDMDRITGLMTGADDYVVKPFNPLELTLRVKSLLRRAYNDKPNADDFLEESDVIRLGNLEINKFNHSAEVNGRPLALTSKEFGILHLLALHPGRVFSAEDIFRQVWKEKYFDANNTVMVHISNLRDKLEQELGEKLISTVWGVGYKIES
ncbi:MAG: two-component system response regulator [Paenibacillus sp.]|jgi:DNA-binding response OmpR family regulator|nr:two-component system response regulator [Paenibacillus sp.]